MLSQKVASCHASKLMSDRMLLSPPTAPPLLSPPLICPLPSDVDQKVLQFSLLATHCSAIATAFWYTSNLITCPLLSKVDASTLACKKLVAHDYHMTGAEKQIVINQKSARRTQLGVREWSGLTDYFVCTRRGSDVSDVM